MLDIFSFFSLPLFRQCIRYNITLPLPLSITATLPRAFAFFFAAPRYDAAAAFHLLPILLPSFSPRCHFRRRYADVITTLFHGVDIFAFLRCFRCRRHDIRLCCHAVASQRHIA